MSKLSIAYVLSDVPGHGLKAGELVEATAAAIKALAEQGSVDTHKDAVAYWRGAGAKLVRSSVELAAEQRVAAADALRVEIAHLQDLKAKAEDEATQGALVVQIHAKQLALAELA